MAQTLEVVCQNCRPGQTALDENGRCNAYCSKHHYCGTSAAYQDQGWNCDLSAARGCFSTSGIPVGGFSFQACSNGNGNHFLQLDASLGGQWTGRGRIDFGCGLGTICKPTGGKITIERQLWPPKKTKNKPNVKGSGGKKEPRAFEISGTMGFMIAMDKPKNGAGGVDVTLTPFGSMTVNCIGLASGSGTFAGNFAFKNMIFDPFDPGTFEFSLSVQVDIQIGTLKWTVIASMDSDGNWSAKLPSPSQILASGGKAMGDTYVYGMDKVYQLIPGGTAKVSKAMTKRRPGGR